MGSQGSDQDLEAGQGYCGHPVDIRDPRSGGHRLADSFRKKGPSLCKSQEAGNIWEKNRS